MLPPPPPPPYNRSQYFLSKLILTSLLSDRVAQSVASAGVVSGCTLGAQSADGAGAAALAGNGASSMAAAVSSFSAC